MPIQSRLTARMPMTTANRPSATTVPRISIGLSFVPNWRMANSLTATGTWSMTHSPTETTGEMVPRSRPLTSWATPKAAPAATRPASAPCHHRSDATGAGGRSPAGGSIVEAEMGWPMPPLRDCTPFRITLTTERANSTGTIEPSAAIGAIAATLSSLPDGRPRSARLPRRPTVGADGHDPAAGGPAGPGRAAGGGVPGARCRGRDRRPQGRWRAGRDHRRARRIVHRLVPHRRLTGGGHLRGDGRAGRPPRPREAQPGRDPALHLAQPLLPERRHERVRGLDVRPGRAGDRRGRRRDRHGCRERPRTGG